MRPARAGTLRFVIVDGSASTLRGGALSRAKGLLAALLGDAGTGAGAGWRVGVLVFGGARLHCIKPCGRLARRSVEPLLAQIGGGGGTPLRRALQKARRTLQNEAARHPREHQQLLLLTDGRSRDAVAGIDFGAHCERCVIDIEAGAVRLRYAQRIAAELGARYHHLDTLDIIGERRSTALLPSPQTSNQRARSR